MKKSWIGWIFVFLLGAGAGWFLSAGSQDAAPRGGRERGRESRRRLQPLPLPPRSRRPSP